MSAELDGGGRRVGLSWLGLRRVELLRSTFGREALVTTVAGRLRRSVRAEAGVVRCGDGRFAVVLGDSADPGGFARAAERRRAEVGRAVLIAGPKVRPSRMAAGVAAPEDGRTAVELLAAAETARELAAAEPGEPFRRLAPASRKAVEVRRHRRRELLEAAQSGAFFPLFEPQLDLVTGAIDRAEVS